MNKGKDNKQKIEKAKIRKRNKKIQYEVPKLVDIESVGVAAGHTCPYGGGGPPCQVGSFLSGSI